MNIQDSKQNLEREVLKKGKELEFNKKEVLDMENLMKENEILKMANSELRQSERTLLQNKIHLNKTINQVNQENFEIKILLEENLKSFQADYEDFWSKMKQVLEENQKLESTIKCYSKMIEMPGYFTKLILIKLILLHFKKKNAS